jgi:DNA segregation ATPase FtsK/SpoIIIE-like protein
MPFSTNTARVLEEEPRPRPSLVRVPARHINFPALAQELNSDAQLQQALRITGTAMLGVATDGVPLIIRLASPDVTHVLISGAKASGKTQLLRTLLGSLALFQKPRELQFLVIAENASAFEFLAAGPCMLWWRLMDGRNF